MDTINARPSTPEERITCLAAGITASLADGLRAGDKNVTAMAIRMLDLLDEQGFDRYAELLSKVSITLFESGHSSAGISVGKQIATRASIFDNVGVQRKIANVLGAQHCDTADFASAMTYLESAVVLARKIGDPTVEAACLANVIAVLQEMGHYRQAIVMAERVLKLGDMTYMGRSLKLQCASNGLFAAHRIGDGVSAAHFLALGQAYLSEDMNPLRRIFFERGRVLYLVDAGQTEVAIRHLADTTRALANANTPRIHTLLTISTSICDWAIGSRVQARQSLESLYEETKRSRLYHHFVLQALIKVYSDSATPAEASVGLAHAKELVEYTTSVKKAKFYRQLAERKESNDRSASLLNITSIDAFDAAKDWLSTSEISPPSTEIPTNRRELAKHEELTAIHEDMARLRVTSLRREIRTDAVDTAENWALAAEFFDDETGRHCYRVGHLASMLARELHMNETFCVQVEHAARLHDIGKIAVNELILLKPGPLDASEMAAMRLHTEVGAQILSGSDDPTLMMAVEVARHHHEWWNGAGYPAKLAGKQIPLSARVSAFADVYDALTHARAYKKAWSHERALEEILRLAGTQFDPELVDPFCRVLDRYRADLASDSIPGFVDMASNALISSRRKLMETISGNGR